ncbi:MAG: hypothetical protein L0Z71_00900 [Anaerolineae bacterium]|nr:hypothetical protein [Anaerolineae bacterium]
MAYDQKTVRQLYKKLLSLYPLPFREQLGESMEQTFNDLYKERQTEHGSFGFVFWMFAETSTGIAREYMLLITQGDTMKSLISNPRVAAFVGFLLALPFLVMNTIVGSRIEPFYSLIRPDTHTSPFEYVLLAVVLLLLPVGAFFAVRPIFQKGVDGKRKFYPINIILGAILVMGFVALSIGLGSDIYRCDVLHIPNCD